MKKYIILIVVFMSLIFSSFSAFPQCEPMTPEECPDPENNGQICPDSLQAAFLNQFYSQVATIKPPAVYYLPPDSTQINLHHVKLMQVANLPEGLSWQSNTPDSVFVAGEYYCVLMEGTPVTAGNYPLKITVDVYVMIFNVPVKVATVTDSTSLSIAVVDNSGIGDGKGTALNNAYNAPNPFKDVTQIVYFAEQKKQIEFAVYSLQGNMVYKENLEAVKGENNFIFDGRQLSPGMYFYRLKSGGDYVSGKMIRSNQLR